MSKSINYFTAIVHIILNRNLFHKVLLCNQNSKYQTNRCSLYCLFLLLFFTKTNNPAIHCYGRISSEKSKIILFLSKLSKGYLLQVILCQTNIIGHQFTQNMTTDLIRFSTKIYTNSKLAKRVF